MKEIICVLDIESSGLSHKKDCILELGMVSLNTKTGEIKPLFNHTFKEKHLTARHRTSWIFDNSDMTLEDIRESEDIEFYREEIQGIFDKFKDNIVAYNRNFDADFLESRGFDLGEAMGDPMRISTDYFKLPSKNGRGFKWPKVTECFSALFPDEEYEEAHRGYSDSEDEARIIFELIKLGVYKG